MTRLFIPCTSISLLDVDGSSYQVQQITAAYPLRSWLFTFSKSIEISPKKDPTEGTFCAEFNQNLGSSLYSVEGIIFEHFAKFRFSIKGNMNYPYVNLKWLLVFKNGQTCRIL